MAIAFCVCALFMVGTTHAQVTATWTGLGDGVNYSDPLNWSDGVVPINDGTTYDVVIPSGFSVDLDSGVSLGSVIDELQLLGTATLNVTPNRQLTVLNNTLLEGILTADGTGADFDASGLGVSFGGNARGIVTGGATVAIGAPSYAVTIDPGVATLFSADGANSELNLPSLGSFAMAAASNSTMTVSATNGGLVNLSGTTSVTGVTAGVGRLRFLVDGTTSDINLNALGTIDGRTWIDLDNNAAYSLPALTTADGMQIDVDATSSLDLPLLTTYRNASVLIEDGGIVTAPLLTTFTNSILDLNPQRTFTTALLSDITDSRISVSGGLTYNNVNASSYALTINPGVATLFSADGANSELNLSSLGSFATTAASNSTMTVSATNGGLVNLSGTTSVTGVTAGVGRLRFLVDGTTSDINLNALGTIDGRTWIDLDNNAAYSLPALTTADGMQIDVDATSSLDLPLLTTYRNASVLIEDGGIVTAPLLTTFTNSILDLNPQRTFTTALLSDITDSRISVSGGLTYNNVNASAYAVTINPGVATLFSADGANSELNLPSLGSFAMAAASNSTMTVSATNGGLVNLSGTTSVTGVTSGNGRLRFRAETGGKIRFGDFDANARTSLEADGSASIIEVLGNVSLNSPVQLFVTDSATVQVGGDFSYDLTNTSDFNFDAGTLVLEGAGSQTLEVGGGDLGIGGALSGNFGIGQLIVGSDSQQSFVQLVDLFDNTATATPEALYLYGNGGEGLQILNDSTLVLNGLNVYAWDSLAQSQVHLNSLFEVGDLSVPFGAGFLQLAAATAPIAWSATGNGNWHDFNNWSPQLIPNTIDGKAIFGDAITGDTTVTVDDNTTIAEIEFNNAADSYTLADDGSHTLTLAGAARINVVAGSHTINTPIAGSAGLRKTGPGTLSLGGNNTYTGPTTIAAGTLALTDSTALAGTSLVDVAAGATLDALQPAVLQLSAGTSLTGSGTVKVNVLDLTSGSELRGALRVQGNVLNSAGLVAPGFSPEIITIVGDYLQQSDGVLEIEIGGLSAGTEHDLLIVTGDVGLGGRLEVPLINGYMPSATDEIRFLIAGQIDPLQNNFDSISIPDLATVAPGLAFELIVGTNDAKIRFDVPKTDIQFQGAQPMSNFTDLFNWTTNTVPGTRNIVTIGNQPSLPQEVLVTTNNAFVYDLTVVGNSAPMTVSVQPAGNLSAINSISVDNDGIVQLNDGTVVTSMLQVNGGGLVTGNGLVDGNLIVGEGGGGMATLSPGLGIGGVGNIVVERDFLQNANSELMIDVDGILEDAFDTLTIMGNATLDGTVEIMLDDIADAPVGSVIQIISASNVTGTFDNVITTGVTGIFLAPVYGADFAAMQSFLIGDMNRNGAYDEADAAAFATALVDPDGYLQMFGIGAGESGDVDERNNGIDFDDIQPFVDRLNGTLAGGMTMGRMLEIIRTAQNPVPEPSSMMIALCGILFIAQRKSIYHR